MEKLQSVDWRGLYKTATNKVKKYTMNLSELELQVEDATSLEVWGPHGSVMTEIAESSFDPESYRQIMGVIARRLKEEGENWRMCYKALLLLEFLIKHGPTQVVRDVESSGGVLDRLTRFQFKDPNGKDHGQNVRHRAGEIVALVADPPRLAAEREKARANRTKYTGVVSSWAPSVQPSGGWHQSVRGSVLAGDSFTLGEGEAQGASLSPGLSTSFSGGAGVGAGAGLDDGSHYISRRRDGAGAGGAEDAVAATRARIESLRASRGAAAAAAARSTGLGAGAEEGKRRLLADTRVDPRIAASLGLKLAAAQPAARAPALAGEADGRPGPESGGATRQHASSDDAVSLPGPGLDLLGDLVGEDAPAPMPQPAADPFDPFAPAGLADEDAGPPRDAWDAFAPGPTPPGPTPLAAASNARAPLPEDAFSSLSLGSPGAGPPALGAVPSGLGALPPVAPLVPTQKPAPQAASSFGSMLSAGGYGLSTPDTRSSKPDPFADLLG
ncbi:Clathrin interactor EPSIN 3 [Auxenochlorella protothecoides]|uniref:Clathrin interactor EPSIN 3 n=1 Tax=Auxenochlorella protothecoides TaxID=3075 RepID=A0A087SHT8_AUXPR|nr:Clathrin interactor EPSIN 3 [Auxenochlorella protothecoides]KFM25292.1 Clathrin interactor EPSIN 3 [Auxenochlorella protothecoides]